MDDMNQDLNIFNSNENDNNYINDINSENYINSSDNDVEQNSEDSNDEIFNNEIIHKYKKENYKIKDIISILMKSNLLNDQVNCSKFNNIMKLIENKSYTDEYVWRCFKKGDNKHDIKQNIRVNSIFEDVKTDIRLLYFIIFENFIYNFSINTVYKNCKEFSRDIGIKFISRNYLGKIYMIIRNKIMKKMHKLWNLNNMAVEPCLDGKSKIEIDESKFITYDGSVRWMFGLVDRAKYDIRVFYVNDNRQKETLLPIVKNNEYTIPERVYNNEDGNNINLPTRIYSDCFQSYQESDFNQLGFILHRINHSLWFAQGSFHTNTIEGVWSRLKRLTYNFCGISGFTLKKFAEKGINVNDYANGIICSGLFFMECEHKNLGINGKKNLLVEYLKYD